MPLVSKVSLPALPRDCEWSHSVALRMLTHFGTSWSLPSPTRGALHRSRSPRGSLISAQHSWCVCTCALSGLPSPSSCLLCAHSMLTASPSLGSKYLKGPKGKCRKNINSATGLRYNGELHYLLAGNEGIYRRYVIQIVIIVLLFVCPLTWCQRDEHTIDDELQVVFSYHTGYIFHAPTCTARSRARILRLILHPLLGWSSPLERRRTCGWRIHRHNSKGHLFEHSNEGGTCSMTLVRVRACDQ